MSTINRNVPLNQALSLATKEIGLAASRGNFSRQVQLICNTALAALILIPIIKYLSKAMSAQSKEWAVPTKEVKTAAELKARYSQYLKGIESSSFRIIKSSQTGQLQVKFYFRDESSVRKFCAKVDAAYLNAKTSVVSDIFNKNESFQKTLGPEECTYTLTGSQAQFLSLIPYDKHNGNDKRFGALMKELFDNK